LPALHLDKPGGCLGSYVKGGDKKGSRNVQLSSSESDERPPSESEWTWW